MKAPWRKPHALVASAAKMAATKNGDSDAYAEAWQNRALKFYENCGEINFSAKFYARMLARVRFYPAEIQDDGSLKAIDSGAAVDVMNRIQDPGGGRTQLQYDYGRLMMITGEGALCASKVGEDGEEWRFLWTDELETDTKSGTTYRKDVKGQRIEQVTSYRMWTPSPVHSEKADSPIRAILEIAQELSLLTSAVQATAVSRMLNGLLMLPSEVMPPPVEPGQDGDPEKSPLLEMFIEHIRATIENPSSPEAKIPFLLVAAYEYLDRVNWVQLHDPQADYLEKDLRQEAIGRLGLGLDMPPEALEGFSNTNHWAAQQIQWDMWRAHGVPKADQFARDIAAVILRPALRVANQPWERVGVGYDDSQVVISPDQTAVADQAWDRGQISDFGYRKMKGIPEDYAPSEEEKAFVVAIKTRNVEVAGYDVATPPAPHGPPGQDQVSKDGQSNVPPAPKAGRVVSRQEAMTSSITGAARLAIRQCRSKAGARLRAKAHRPPGHEPGPCPECAEKIADIDNSLVASALSVDDLTTLAMNDPIRLVQGGTSDFRGILEEWGVQPNDVAVLCERIEAFAAKTLFEPNTPSLPPGFAAHVEHALEVAGRALASDSA